MKFRELQRAMALTREYSRMTESEGVVVVVLDEEVRRLRGYNAAPNRATVMRNQGGNILIYGAREVGGQAGEPGIFDVNTHDRYYILVYQPGVNMQSYGPLYMSYSNQIAQLVDSRGRQARGRRVQGNHVYTFTEMPARELLATEELLVAGGHQR